MLDEKEELVCSVLESFHSRERKSIHKTFLAYLPCRKKKSSFNLSWNLFTPGKGKSLCNNSSNLSFLGREDLVIIVGICSFYGKTEDGEIVPRSIH
jgi:hypothetical protein